MEASWQENGVEKHQTLTLAPGAPAPLDEQGAAVALVDFLPDYVLQGNQIASQSDDPRNPAIHLQVTRPAARSPMPGCWPSRRNCDPPNDTGINFRFVSVEMDSMTGLAGGASSPGNG